MVTLGVGDEGRGTDEGSTFRNPVHGSSLADPFVLKFNGHYYAYGTPTVGDGLPVLRSTDLVSWVPVSDAAVEPPPPGQAHWAPEVAYRNGRFHLYYSTGGPEGEGHQLRVATGRSPAGPFDDPVVLDPEEQFTIDAHPFRDDDGQWYLFYCRDFLHGEPVGTGVVVDRLVDMSTLAGEAVTVMRPHAEWHIYERSRRWYDRVWDWYTVEGPFVTKHDGRYWCFYSGGAWRAESYGISSAVAGRPLGPFEPLPSADGADVLRTVPGAMIGPGHGGLVLAPDNVAEYLVYHAWDPQLTGRYPCVDRLVWAEGRPTSPGPRPDPQPRPPDPDFRDLFDQGEGRPVDPASWRVEGRWRLGAEELVQPDPERPATAVLRFDAPASYLFEVNLALRSGVAGGAAYGAFASYLDGATHTAVVVQPDADRVAWRSVRGGAPAGEGVVGRIRGDFAATAYHRLVLRRDGSGVQVTLDDLVVGSVPARHAAGGAVGLFTGRAAAAFAGVSLTDLDRAERRGA
ncbi:MAG: glycoside hydrolase family 43 protein [Actinomycetota bacterium]|nr:glycoside hydrolase family 43 protein [Actinomycetota bacterium]